MSYKLFIKEVRDTILFPLCDAVLRHVESAIEDGRVVLPDEGEEFFNGIASQAMSRLLSLQPASEIQARIEELESLVNYLKADTERAIKQHNMHIFPEGTYPYKGELEKRILDLKMTLKTVYPRSIK